MSTSLHPPSSDEHGVAQDGVTPEQRISDLEGQLQKLQESFSQQETAQRELDEFISLLAHDLRTPLTSIRGYSQLLLRQLSSHGADAERLRGGLHTVIQQADRLSDLTSVLLDIARVRTGRLALRRAAVDVAQIARAVIEDTRDLPEAPNVELEAPSTGLMIDGDSQRITQALESLVDFSLERTPPAQSVTVRLNTVPGSGGPPMVEFAVSDDGAPLSPDEAQRLFHQLVKPAEGGPTERALGSYQLYIARGIVETHGGSVGVESPVPGTSAGARLTLRLPLQD